MEDQLSPFSRPIIGNTGSRGTHARIGMQQVYATLLRLTCSLGARSVEEDTFARKKPRLRVNRIRNYIALIQRG